MNLFGKNLDEEVAVIAEIGVNHEGSLSKALELIEYAKASGADAVKFQSYTPERYVSSVPKERMDRIRKFSLSLEDHIRCFNMCREIGVEFISTPLSEDWVEKLEPYVSTYKIASGDITFKQVIQACAKTGKNIILSTGASNIQEISSALNWISEVIGKDHLKERIVVAHCVSSYPTPINQANINSVRYLKEKFGLYTGYSNHVIEPEASLAAVALGARLIEVHFTDNKQGRGFRDHQLSFEPKGLKSLIDSIKIINKSLGSENKEIQPCESDMRSSIRKGIIYSRDLDSDVCIKSDDLMFARPERFIPASEANSLIGRKLTKSAKKGEPVNYNQLYVNADKTI